MSFPGSRLGALQGVLTGILGRHPQHKLRWMAASTELVSRGSQESATAATPSSLGAAPRFAVRDLLVMKSRCFARWIIFSHMHLNLFVSLLTSIAFHPYSNLKRVYCYYFSSCSSSSSCSCSCSYYYYNNNYYYYYYYYHSDYHSDYYYDYYYDY